MQCCLQSSDTVIDYDRAFSLPAYRAVSHVWLKSNRPSQDLFNPNHILSATPIYSTTFCSCHPSISTFAFTEPWARPGDDSNCWWASELLPPSALSAERAIEQQTFNHMWQYEDRRPQEGAARGVNRLWQQHWLTIHTSAGAAAIYIS